jgi:hypothetical protein
LARAREHGTAFAEAFPTIAIPEFPNRDYWFLTAVSEEMALLKRRIDQLEPIAMREFFYLVFSALIITKSASSVANVRDLAHSRPHFVAPRVKPDVIKMFRQRLTRLARGVTEFADRCDSASSVRIVGDDARQIPLPAASVDLVFTSPPYVNAIDYPRAHKFSLHWLGDALDVTPDQYRELGRSYIGTDRVPISTCLRLATASTGVAELDRTLDVLAAADPRRAGVARRYFEDMGAVLGEVGRVLRRGRHAVVVVCPSAIAGVRVATHALLADLAEHVSAGSLRHVETHERTLDDSKRQLPIMRGRFGPGMRTEYVVVLRKG